MRDGASEGVPQNVEQPQEEASKGLMFKLFHCYSGPWALPGRSRRPAGISKCAPPRFHTFLAVFRTLIKVPLCSPASARGLPLDLSHGLVLDFSSPSAPFPMLSTPWRCAGGNALCGTGESTPVVTGLGKCIHSWLTRLLEPAPNLLWLTLVFSKPCPPKGETPACAGLTWSISVGLGVQHSPLPACGRM